VFVQTVHVVDTTAPVFDNCPADATAECTPSAPPTVTATDNCDASVSVGLVTGDPVSAEDPACPQHYTITRTWTATDDCGNSDTCVQVITVQDTTAPTISCNDGEPDVNDDIVVNAAAGSCTAVVSIPSPTVGDACDPSPGMAFVREDGAGSLSAPFSSSFAGVHGVGVTEIVWTATDACGNTANCSQTVTVNAVNEVVNLSIELQGVNSPVSRCVRIIGTPGACQGTDGFATLSFVDHDGDDANHNGLVDASEPALIAATRVRAVVPSASNPNPVLIACGVYSGICIKDEQHGLIASTGITDGGTQYVGGSLMTLMGGDTDNDSDVDIHDVTFFLSRFGTPDPSYACGSYDVEAHRGADFSVNGNVGAEDYTFLSDNWQLSTTCSCSSPFLGEPDDQPLPADDVLAPQIQFTDKRSLLASEMAPDVAVKVDLNRDGRFDYLDVERFENERGYSHALSAKMRGGAIPGAVGPAGAAAVDAPVKAKKPDSRRIWP
jgi:hypothetical protein